MIRTSDDLHDYQFEALQFMEEEPFSALFIDVGMGKTISVYTLLHDIFESGYRRKVLIIAPIRVANTVWMEEYKIWYHTKHFRPKLLRVADDDPRLRRAYKRGYQRAREQGNDSSYAAAIGGRVRTIVKERIRTRMVFEGDEQIHVIDHGSVEWLVDKWANKREWPYRIVIFDEASVLGDYRNRVFKALRKVRNNIDRFHELTASPASQTYMKFFSQIWLLDKGERFGNFITHFRDRYFSSNQYSRTYEILPGAAEEIERKIADICFVRMREKRETIIRTHPIRLDIGTMEKYTDFERHSVLEYAENDFIEATTAANLSSKLLQLATGAVYDEKRNYRVFHDEKIEELKEIVDQTLDQPLLVAYWFRSSLDRLKKTFPDAAVMDREGKMEKQWNERKFKMMIVHPRSAGHGLNLQFGGHHLVLFDIFWPLELFLQLIGRLDRQGQIETVIVHMLSAVGTMDEVVTAKLQNLESAQDAMFRRLRALHRRYQDG